MEIINYDKNDNILIDNEILYTHSNDILLNQGAEAVIRISN